MVWDQRLMTSKLCVEKEYEVYLCRIGICRDMTSRYDACALDGRSNALT